MNGMTGCKTETAFYSRIVRLRRAAGKGWQLKEKETQELKNPMI